MRFAYLFASNLLYLAVLCFLKAKTGPYHWADIAGFGGVLGYVLLILWIVPLLVTLVTTRLLAVAAQVRDVYSTSKLMGNALVLASLLLNGFLVTNSFGLQDTEYQVLALIKASVDTGLLLSCKQLTPLPMST